MRVAIALIIVLSISVYAAAQSQQTAGSQTPVTQKEIDQLKQQILNETRSSFEVLTDFHHESGDLNNRLDQFRYGGKLNFRLNSESGVYVKATRADFRLLNSALNEWGVNFTGGLVARLGEYADLHVEGGATRFSTDTVTTNGLLSLRMQRSDVTNVYVTASRSNVDESLLSLTGVRPVAGPFAGQLVGRVMDNRAVVGGTAKLPLRFDVFGEGGVGTRKGSNVPSNFFGTAGGGVGYTVLSTGADDPVNLVRAALEINYAGFQDNRFGFGGASFLSRTGVPIAPLRIGSDLISPDPTPRPGVGGYFSPRNFVSDVVRGEVQGGSELSLSYRVSGFIGSQWYSDNPRRLTGGVSGTITIALSDRFALPITYTIDNYGPFRQQSLFGRLVVRF